jgi:PncC family amidohydrolase
VYSNSAKEALLGVPARMLAEHGAVSEPVVRAMAEAVRARTGATWAVSITGIAGPSGGTPDKPAGTVWLACAGPQPTRARLAHFRGDRSQVRLASVYGALQMVREGLGLAPLSNQ